MLRKLDAHDVAQGRARSREGLATYLEYHGGLMYATSKRSQLSAEERLFRAWCALLWSVYHRMYIVVVDGYTLEQNFMSDQSYHDALLRCGRVACTLVAQALTDVDLPFCPWQHGEGWLERIFGQVRAGHGIQRSVSTTTLRERLRRAAFRIRAQLTSCLRTANCRSKRLDVEGRRERGPPLPSLRTDLGGAVDEHTLAQLISRTSRCAFEHVRSSLHRLDMARELIASGCPELQLTAPALAFSLTVRHGPFDDT